MMQKLTADREQMQKLRECLGTGCFDVSIIPEIKYMFREKIQQNRSLAELSYKYRTEDGKADELADIEEWNTYFIDLNRDLKVCILETLQTGMFPITKAMPTLTAVLKENEFLKWMIAATSENDENTD